MLLKYVRHTIMPILVGFALVIPIHTHAITMGEAAMRNFPIQEKHFGLPPGILARIAQQESNGDATTRTTSCPPGKKCTALGLFQFTERTWILASQGLYGKPANLELRTNPIIATEVAAYSLQQIKSANLSLIIKSKIDPSAGIYAGHFLGLQGSKVFLSNLAEHPDDPAKKYLPKEADTHHVLFYDNDRPYSLKEFANLLTKIMSKEGIKSIKNADQTFTGTMKPDFIRDEKGSADLTRKYTPPQQIPDEPSRTFQDNANDYQSALNNAILKTKQQEQDLAAQADARNAEIRAEKNAAHKAEIQNELNNIRRQQQEAEQEQSRYETQRTRQYQDEQRQLDQLDQQRRSDAQQQRTQQEQERTTQEQRQRQQEQLAQLERDRPQQQQSHPPFQQTPQLQQSSQLQPQQQQGQGQQPQSPQQQSGTGQSFGQGANQPYSGNTTGSGLSGSPVGTASTFANTVLGSASGAQSTPSGQNVPLSLQEQVAQAFRISNTEPAPTTNPFNNDNTQNTQPIDRNVIRSVIAGLSSVDFTSTTINSSAQNKPGTESAILSDIQSVFADLGQLLSNLQNALF